MTELTYTLLAEGPSDQALLPILRWTLRQHLPDMALQEQWADLRRLPNRPRKLAERIDAAVKLYPCHVLFIHRDADQQPRLRRVEEILKAKARSKQRTTPSICVVPVRMTEAWLLGDEDALRWAAGNPNGKAPLAMSVGNPEAIPNPKGLLNDLLVEASELTGRRRKKFRARAGECVLRLAVRIANFSALRALPAFGAMEAELVGLLSERGWAH